MIDISKGDKVIVATTNKYGDATIMVEEVKMVHPVSEYEKSFEPVKPRIDTENFSHLINGDYLTKEEVNNIL